MARSAGCRQIGVEHDRVVMKPVGLTNTHNPGVKLYAVVPLRQDNALGTLFNMV